MKIALIGSAPSSVQLAPYDDPEWVIWGCSPGAYGHVRNRSDAWFEMHRWEPPTAGTPGTGKPWFSPEYCQFLAEHKGPVYMLESVPEIPNSKPFPVHDMAREFGPFFWTSTLSYMWALALSTPGVTHIGMWGVDMAAPEEYGYQRAGCQYFITLAMQRGIQVIIPPESDILQPTVWYGVTESHPMHVKLTARTRELEHRRIECEQTIEAKTKELWFVRGALDDVKYMMDTWVTWQSWVEPNRKDSTIVCIDDEWVVVDSNGIVVKRCETKHDALVAQHEMEALKRR